MLCKYGKQTRVRANYLPSHIQRALMESLLIIG